MSHALQSIDNLDPKLEPVRDIPLVEVEIDNPTCGQLQIGTCIAEPGLRLVRCYEDEVPKLESMVESDELTAKAAERAYETAIAKEVMNRVEGFQGQAADMIKAIKDGAEDVIVEAHELVLKTTGRSVQGEFNKLAGRDMLPLRSVKVVRRGLVEPQAKLAQDALTRSLAVVQEAMGMAKGGGGDTAALMEMLAEAQATNAKLAKRIDALENTKKKG